MVKDLLENFNITERKSKTLMPPNILDDNLKKYFIKGLIDGDGSVGQDRVTIYGTFDMLNWVKEFFDENYPPKNQSKLSKVIKIQTHLYSYRIGSSRAIKLIEDFRKLNVQGLDRKWYHPTLNF